MTITEFFISYEVWITVGALYKLTTGLKGYLGDLAERKIVKRLLPLVPGIIGALIGLVPGWLPADSAGERVLCGTLVGFCAPMLYGLMKKRPSDGGRSGAADIVDAPAEIPTPE